MIATAIRPWRGERRDADALGLLTAYVAVLLLIPSRLVVGPLGANGSVAGLFGLVLLGWWAMVRLLPSLRASRRFQPIRLALGLLLASILASYAWSALHPLPPDQRQAADNALVAVLALAGPALVATDLLSRRSSVEALLRRVVILAAIVAAIGVLQFATGFSLSDAIRIPGLRANGAISVITERSEFRRVSATTDHPIELGMVLATVLPLALHFQAYERRRRLLWTIVAVLVACTIPMTLSRSAIIGLAVATIVMLWGWNGSQRARFLLVAPVFVVVLRLSIPGLVGTISSLFTNASTDPSVLNRTEAYGQAGHFISASPWLGRGFGTFIPQQFFFLDNQYLGTIVEAGYIGLVALLGFLLLAWTTARRLRRRSLGAAQRDLAQALAAAVAVVAIGFTMFDGLGFPTIDGVLFIVVGCIGALWRLSTEERRSPFPEQVLARHGSTAP